MMRRSKETRIMLSEAINQRDELLNILKAIINKFDMQQISISKPEIVNASKYEIYTKREILRNATIYQLIDTNKFLEKQEGDKDERRRNNRIL